MTAFKKKEYTLRRKNTNLDNIQTVKQLLECQQFRIDLHRIRTPAQKHCKLY